MSYTSATKLPFVLIDLSKMRAINVDLAEKSVWVEAGATLGELYYRVAEKSNAYGIAAGLCTSLGLVVILLSLAQISSSKKTVNTFLFHQCLSTTQTSSTSFTPNNPNFTSILNSTAQNLRCIAPSMPKPGLIFTPLDVSHVQTVVICAKKHGIQLRFRSGGHDYEGLSYTSATKLPFVLIDLSKMRAINVDLAEKSVWVEAGATLGELYYRVAEKSNAYGIAAGLCT
nr:berberine/berberine-like protein [Tanacetum cinerariifolium]